MNKEIQAKINGLHSGTKIREDMPLGFFNRLEVHLHQETKEVVIVHTEVLPDGAGCIDKESEVVGWFENESMYKEFINLINNKLYGK